VQSYCAVLSAVIPPHGSFSLAICSLQYSCVYIYQIQRRCGETCSRVNTEAVHLNPINRSLSGDSKLNVCIDVLWDILVIFLWCLSVVYAVLCHGVCVVCVRDTLWVYSGSVRITYLLITYT
jgi:hypothetical protein